MKRLIAIIGALPVFIGASSQIKWDGGGMDGLWSTATNWVGDAVPGAADNVLLDNSIVTNSYTVNLPAGAVTITINTLVITPNGANAIQLIIPSTNTADPGLNITGPGDALILNNNSILKNSTGTGSGGVGLGITNTFRINNGGRYIHNNVRANASIISQLSTATGTENGTFEFDVPSLASYTISVSGRTFGNLILSSASSGGTKPYASNSANPILVRGFFEIGSFVNYTLNLSSTFNIEGNYIQASSSSFNISNAPALIKIKGNLTSQGTIVNNSSGLTQIELNGTSNQNINVTGSITNQVEFIMNNPAGVTLLSSLILPYNLQLLNGKIKTTSGALLTMIDNAICTGGSSVSFIEGPMRKIGDDAFTFPTGVGMIYAPVGISAGGSASDDFTAEYKRSSPQITFGSNYESSINHISYVEYWRLIQDVGNSSRNVTLTVTPYSFAKNMNTLFVSYSNGTTGFQWQNKGLASSSAGTPSPPYVTGTITGNPVNAFGIFTIGTTESFSANPLPVNLISFEAFKKGNGALLQWNLSSVYDREAKFEILKSKGGITFNSVKTIQADETKMLYEYLDNYNADDVTYYQLKMIDADGSVSYSRIVSVISNMPEIVITSLMPAIIKNTATIKIISPLHTAVELYIVDVNGRLVKKQSRQLLPGNNVVTISCEQLQAGIYILAVKANNGKTNSVKFVKR